MTDRTIRMLRELDARAQVTFEKLFASLDNELGETQYIFFEGRRRLVVHEAYYAQGRDPLDVVNVYRQKAGLYLLRSEKDNYIITWTMQSKHLDGLAGDVLPVDGKGNPTWDLAHFRRQFEIIRDCGREVGLVCGADWSSPHTD